MAALAPMHKALLANQIKSQLELKIHSFHVSGLKLTFSETAFLLVFLLIGMKIPCFPVHNYAKKNRVPKLNVTVFQACENPTGVLE